MRKVFLTTLCMLLIASLTGCQQSGTGGSSGGSESDSADQALEEARKELTRAKQEAREARQDAENAREDAEASSTSEDKPEISPSETLGIQYEYMNTGQYEQAYDMLAEQSQRIVPLEQYVGFFPPSYEVSDYSVNSEQIDGNIATVQADLAVFDPRQGERRYPVTQELVQADGEWQVILRDAQVETFTSVQAGEPRPESSSPENPAASSSQVTVRVTGSGAFSGNYGTLEASRSVDGVAPAEYRVEDLDMDALSFDSVTAVMQKTGAGASELGVQIVVAGEVVRESYTSAEYGVTQVSWSPSE